METRLYKKGEVIKSYRYEDGRILATVEIAGVWVANPQESALLADGWERYTPPTPPPYEPTRSEKIHAEIRARYTDNDEFMILRQKDSKPEQFEEYNAFVESVLAKYPEED